MILIIFAFLFSPVNEEQDLLRKGLMLQEEGKYEQALEVWADAFTVLEQPSLAIAHAYINLSTREGLTDYYEIGSKLYQWSLSGKQLYGEPDVWEKEVAWLSPILDRDDIKKIETLLNNGDPSLASVIAGYWNRVDPTPGTKYNERFLEHWERITYAQRNFTKNNNTVYDTDDRGLDYVKFGAPDLIHTGKLYADASSIIEMGSFLGRVNYDVAINVVQQLDPTPEYEIWIYDRMNPSMSENLVLIFGDAALQGFKKVNVIDEFIPNQAFSLSNRFDLLSPRGGGSFGTLSPGMILQWIYYNQLASLDMFFGRQVAHMSQTWCAWCPQASIGKAQGPVFRQKVEMEKQQLDKDTPTDHSTEIEKIPEIPVVTYQYRFLDPGMRPFTAFFVGSDPFDSYVNDFAVNDELMMPESSEESYLKAYDFYKLSHGVRIMDESGGILDQSRIPSQLVVRYSEELQNYSVFTIPWSEKLSSVKAYAELENMFDGSRRKDSTSVFKTSLRGLGVMEAEIDKPIEIVAGELALSDIVFGYDMDASIDNTLFPFNVSHDRTLPSGKAMAVHLEVYNLKTDDQNTSKFNLEYEITEARRMSWLLGDKSSTSLQVLYENSGTRFADNLEIQTRELVAGKYELHLSVNDLNDDRKIETTIPFTVVQ